jgi:tetratricopeptide (TPR) repeat protein
MASPSTFSAASEAASHPARGRSRRPRDQYGLPISTTPEAAEVYVQALELLLTLEDGAIETLERTLELDPDFALGHAVLATLLAEQSADRGRIRAHLHEARRSSAGATEREASFVTTSVLWCSNGLSGDAALVRHVKRWPRDAYALSLVAPSIASAGVSDGVVNVWPLLDELSRSYKGDWWLTSLRAFARSDQEHWSEAEDLAGAALSTKPSAGHASHALAHVYYETGRHREGIDWLDNWLRNAGANQRFRCHFSWHAALYELSMGDLDAVRQRFDRDLGTVYGSRALVDGGSMLARCAAQGHSLGDRRAAATFAAAREVVDALPSPFIAWHTAVLAGVCGDRPRLATVEETARRRLEELSPRSDAAGQSCADAWAMTILVCQAIHAAMEEDHAVAAALLASLGDTRPLGGSPAQRELLDDLALRSLISAGQSEAACYTATRRLRRRETAWDTALVANLTHQP